MPGGLGLTGGGGHASAPSLSTPARRTSGGRCSNSATPLPIEKERVMVESAPELFGFLACTAAGHLREEPPRTAAHRCGGAGGGGGGGGGGGEVSLRWLELARLARPSSP